MWEGSNDAAAKTRVPPAARCTMWCRERGEVRGSMVFRISIQTLEMELVNQVRTARLVWAAAVYPVDDFHD